MLFRSTINAGKSKIPHLAKTPISILTREILQYAKNIDQAIAIAKKRQVFVSESIMIGSANDKKAILRTSVETTKRIKQARNILILSNWAKYFEYKNIDELRFSIINELIFSNKTLEEIKKQYI